MDGRGATFVDRTLAAYGGLRIERQSARGRFTADLFYGHRAFAIPPSDTQGATIQNVTGEDAARAVVGGEARLGPLRIAAGGYGELLSRATDYFRDYTLQSPTSHQDLLSGRAGAAVHLDRWLSRRGVRARISARLAADGEAARIVQAKAAPVTGWSIYSGLAVGGLVHWKWLRLEGAAGMLVALDHPSTWWPEGKLSLAVQPFRWLTLSLIGARKGRLPTLRELYDPLVGNPQLAPEQTWHGELRAELRPHPLVAARWSAYLRRIGGAIRLDPNAAALAGRNVNVDTIDVRGMEVGVDVARGRLVGAGLSYLFEDASSPTLGLDPITDFPRHRLDVYLASTWRGRLGGLLRFRWVSERVVQAVTLPGYQVLDASGWAQLDERLRLVVRVDDVLDQRYVELPGLLSPPTTVTASLEGIWN
jgi:hypothetical protein